MARKKRAPLPSADEPIMAVRLLVSIDAQGLPLEAGTLIGPPVTWAKHLIECGMATKARHPGRNYRPDATDSRFVRRLTDDEVATMLERHVEVIQDPDFPNESFTRESFRLSILGTGPIQPATRTDVEALRAMHRSGTVPARIESARAALSIISDTMEHAQASSLLSDVERLWSQMEDPAIYPGAKVRFGDQAEMTLAHLSTLLGAGLRRRDVRKVLARDSARQSGTRKPKRPDIDKWIGDAIRSDPDATRDELWERAPGWIKDGTTKRDGIGVDRFRKRVSAARKNLK